MFIPVKHYFVLLMYSFEIYLFYLDNIWLDSA